MCVVMHIYRENALLINYQRSASHTLIQSYKIQFNIASHQDDDIYDADDDFVASHAMHEENPAISNKASLHPYIQ